MFTVTYSIVTPESAEDGDCAEHGFVTPGNWHFECQSEVAAAEAEFGPAWRGHWPPAACRMDLRSALRLVAPSCCAGRWFDEADAREDYVTGASETRSLHPPENITPSSFRRLVRLLGVKG